jgi:hypothetical protein
VTAVLRDDTLDESSSSAAADGRGAFVDGKDPNEPSDLEGRGAFDAAGAFDST